MEKDEEMKKEEMMEEEAKKEDAMEEEMVQFEPKKKKRSPFRIIISIITWILVIIIAVSAALGFINIGRVNNGEKPYAVLKEENYQEEESKVQVYHFGLYKIVKVEEKTKTSISLKPFFLKNTK